MLVSDTESQMFSEKMTPITRFEEDAEHLQSHQVKYRDEDQIMALNLKIFYAAAHESRSFLEQGTCWETFAPPSF